MDLYEALKSGASEDELYDSFKREVAKAQKRITEETAQIAKEKVQQEKLAAARKNAVDAIYSYLDLFFKPYVGETKKEIAPKSTILAALVYLVLKLLYWDRFSAGFAPMIIGLFFLNAIELLFIGFVGEYVMSINTRVMNRPLVIEEERINF